MSEIEWRQPPQHVLDAPRRTQYDPFADALRKRPTEWAVLPGEKATPDSAKNTALNIKGGRMAAFKPKGSWEAVTDGTTVYVRYVGEQPQADDAEVVLQGAERSYKASEVRQWARDNEFQVPDRGRLPDHILTAFEEAQDGSDAAPEG